MLTDEPEPYGNSLVAALAGLAIAVGAMMAISWLGDHAETGWRMLAAVTRAMATVIEGG